MKGELSHCPRLDMRHHFLARTVHLLLASGSTPPQAVSAQKIPAATMEAQARTEGRGGTSSAPTLRPQGVVPAASLLVAQAEINRTAHQARRAQARRAHRDHRARRVRLTALRPRLRLRLRGAGPLIHSACAR